jgi:hypothetical protein
MYKQVILLFTLVALACAGKKTENTSSIDSVSVKPDSARMVDTVSSPKVEETKVHITPKRKRATVVDVFAFNACDSLGISKRFGENAIIEVLTLEDFRSPICRLYVDTDPSSQENILRPQSRMSQYSLDKTILWAEIFNPDLPLQGGLKIGMTVEEFLQKGNEPFWQHRIPWGA